MQAWSWCNQTPLQRDVSWGKNWPRYNSTTLYYVWQTTHEEIGTPLITIEADMPSLLGITICLNRYENSPSKTGASASMRGRT